MSDIGALRADGWREAGRRDTLAPALEELRAGARLMGRGLAALGGRLASEAGQAVFQSHSLTLWARETERGWRP